MQVNSVSATDSLSSQDAAQNPQQVLTQKDFLQLLVSQIQNQNPLDPQSDTQMAAQMAQFTSLQQTSAMSGSLAMMQANSLVGSTVELQIDSQTTASGVVDGVVMQNGTPFIVVNGSPFDLSQVVAVVPTTTTSTTTQTTN